MELYEECASDFLVKQTRLILSNYRRWFGEDLWPENQDGEALAKEVFLAPFVLLSADTKEAPVLNYGNQQALQLWEMRWKELVSTPGHQTAEPMERAAREQFLATVKKQGYVDDYEGVRVSKSGRRFAVKNAKVWNLLDEEGNYCGQAATFRDWQDL